MSAFKGLYWKELKIAKVEFFTALVLMLLMYIGTFSAARYYEEPLFMAIPYIFIYLLHFGYLPLFLFSSLRSEGKTQLWLHNPHSGALLFSAKLAANLTYYCISLFIAFLGAYWAVTQIVIRALPAEYSGHGLKELLLIAVFITAMGMYISIWLQFYWTLYHAMKNIPYLKNIRWLIIFGLWLALSIASSFIRESYLYEKIQEAGVIQIHVLQEVNFQISGSAAEVLPTMGTIDISIVSVLLYCLVTVIVFSLSVWLLERKVEV